VTPVAGSPADKAGIEGGDFIEKINGQPTTKMAFWQIRSALRASSPVKLQVLRGGNTKREELTLQAGAFHPVALQTDTISGVGYIRVPYWEKGTATQFRAALDDARKRNVRKLIVDVRGNAAGSIDEAIAAADDLLTSGLITSLEGRKIEPKQWQADRNTSFDGEVEVLADISTASGGEVFASAIRGNNRGKLIGITTYGKAIVQKFVPLPSGGGVQLTVAHYTTPDLKPITDAGLRPDVIVDLTAQALDEEATKGTKRHKDEEDLILKKALQMFGAEPAAQKKAA